MKQFSDEIRTKINAEIEASCIDNDIPSDKAEAVPALRSVRRRLR